MESSELKFTQASIVRFVGWKTGESGNLTDELVPSNRKAEPLKPAFVALAVPKNTPLFVPIMSRAFPSPGHHPTSPDGVERQVAASIRQPVKAAVSRSMISRNPLDRKESRTRLPFRGTLLADNIM
jgi:hypothetical protein